MYHHCRPNDLNMNSIRTMNSYHDIVDRLILFDAFYVMCLCLSLVEGVVVAASAAAVAYDNQYGFVYSSMALQLWQSVCSLDYTLH